jgi:hypothetical protein
MDSNSDDANEASPIHRVERSERTRPFAERDFDELASYLRSAFKVRRVERLENPESGDVELRLLGREDALKHALVFERACLDSAELADLRGYLAQPLVKKRITAHGEEPFRIPSDQIAR